MAGVTKPWQNVGLCIREDAGEVHLGKSVQQAGGENWDLHEPAVNQRSEPRPQHSLGFFGQGQGLAALGRLRAEPLQDLSLLSEGGINSEGCSSLLG